MSETRGYDPAHQTALERYAEAHKGDPYVMPRTPDPTQERSYLDYLNVQFTAFPARDRFEAGGFRTYEESEAAEEAMIEEYMAPLYDETAPDELKNDYGQDEASL